MNDLYRKTFDEVHASEALRQEVLNMTKQEKAVVRRQVPRMVLIAAIVVLALAGTALAAALPGIQEWFSRQWTKETGKAIETDQMGVITKLTDAVGVSDTVDGVTVTVDSVTRGEDVVWFLLELDGLPAEEELEKAFDALVEPQPEEDASNPQKEYHINGTDITVSVSSGAGSTSITGPREYFFGSRAVSFDPAVADSNYYWEIGRNELRADGTRMILLKYRFDPLENAAPQGALVVTLELSDLSWGIFRSTAVPVAEGTFTLEFSLPAIEPAKPLTTGGGTALGEPFLRDIDPSLEFWDTNTMGPRPTEEMAFLRTKATPTNLTIYWADREQLDHLHITGDWYLVMKDGTEVRLDTSGGMYTDLPGGERVSRFLWPVPVDLNQAKSLEYRYGEEVQAFDLK